MKKVIILIILIVSILFFVGCDGSEGQKPTVTTLSVTSTPKSDFQKQEELEARNKEVSKSQEIPVGEENFGKLADFILKNGFTIFEGTAKQYTFFDTKGNRHAYLAMKMDTNNNPSKTGKVSYIVVYGYYKGIRDHEHFFPYQITKETVFCPSLRLDKNWRDYEAVKFGYSEFLAKASK